MESDGKRLPKKIILDIESKNHLEKDCGGDRSKLLIGLAGIKYYRRNKFEFFDENSLDDLKRALDDAELVIGFNIVGHNGLDYKMLENHGINIQQLLPKTYDIMTVLIRAFGSFKGLSLDNIIRNTFDVPKKKNKKANYKLIQNERIEEVKENLKHELKLIERLFSRVTKGGVVNFETSLGLVDQHELPFFDGFPTEMGEDIIEPYDFPVAGIRLQIKDVFNEVIRCKKCKKSWRIKSVCYYGDTMSEDVFCPQCGNLLVNIRTSLMGEPVNICEVGIQKRNS